MLFARSLDLHLLQRLKRSNLGNICDDCHPTQTGFPILAESELKGKIGGTVLKEARLYHSIVGNESQDIRRLEDS